MVWLIAYDTVVVMPRLTAPIIRSGSWNVHLSNDEAIYVNRECGPDDTAGRFFLHLVPADAGDLPPHRRQYGFDNIDFRFQETDGHGHMAYRAAERCLIVLKLPDYDALTAVRVGQYIPRLGRLWEGEHRFGE